MKKLRKAEADIFEIFGKEELEAYFKLDIKDRLRYRTYYYTPRPYINKVYPPSEWIRFRKIGIAVDNECVRMILERFEPSEFEYYKNFNKRDRQSYSGYIKHLKMGDKKITLDDCPSVWHKRVLEKREKFPNIGKKKSSVGKKKLEKYKVENLKELILKPFDTQVIELFSALEFKFFESMIDFAKKYYKAHVRKSLAAGFRVKKPSEWYDEFILTTQCPEMLRLQNRFFGLVKKEISRKDAREYIAYFEYMSYKKERSYL